jgi:hypothetical protein
LAEGIRWLSLARTRGFPTVEGAWQRIRRSGQLPRFERGRCPVCSTPVVPHWEWAHLLVSCIDARVVASREDHLGAAIQYIRSNMIARGVVWLTETVNNAGVEIRTGLMTGAVSIYLAGGLIRPPNAPDAEGWFDTYTLGFGHLRIATPGLQQFNYVPVASFFQTVAPLYLSLIGGDLYGDRSSVGTHSGSSRSSSVNHSSPVDSIGGNDGPLDDAISAPLLPDPPVDQN